MKSLYDFCNENNAQIILDFWDYNLNNVKPNDIPYYDSQKYWFKCSNPKHEPFQLSPSGICNKKRDYTNYNFCSQCKSIGQWFIDNYGEDFLHQKWSDKNTDSPLMIPRGRNNANIWLRCTEYENHPDYELTPNNVSKGVWGCPYCSHKKIVPEESLGTVYPQSLEIWSDKNEKSPFDYTSFSSQKVWWKCENSIHDDYLNKISNQNIFNHFQCVKCKSITNHIYSVYLNLKDQKFGYLTALYQDQNDRRLWHCKCDCGINDYIVDGYKLITGHTKSCGCQSHLLGENSAHWKGGITPELKVIRTSDEYAEWRNSVFKRDNYTCQCCGNNNNKLNAHHIESFADNEELRLDIDNGITLCEECHAIGYPGSFHDVYGTYHNTREQLEEYLQNYKLKSA